MLIVNKRSFARGSALMISFAAVFLLILSPVFPDERGGSVDGLHYADNLFNRLSKGSSWFVPEITPRVKAAEGLAVELSFSLKNTASAPDAVKLLTTAGGDAREESGSVRVKADLGRLLGAVLEDCDAAYHDKAEPIGAKYGMDGYKALALWWETLTPMIKELQKIKRIPEAQLVDLVIRKGIEPAYNFRGIEIGSMRGESLHMFGLLFFYIIYTLWYGFAVFELFEGVGMTMKKGKKQEA
jgi:hypothetical protein